MAQDNIVRIPLTDILIRVFVTPAEIMQRIAILTCCFIPFFAAAASCPAQDEKRTAEINQPEMPKLGDTMTDEQVVSFAKLVLKGIGREYPNKPSNVASTSAIRIG